MPQGYRNEAREQADREARDKQLDAVAAVGEPEITPFILERARRKYFQQFETIQLVRDGRAMPGLPPDARASHVKYLIEQAEPDWREYEHVRSLWESQERQAAATKATKLAEENTKAAAAQATAAERAATAAEQQATAAKVQADAAAKQADLADQQTKAAKVQADAAAKQADLADQQTKAAKTQARAAMASVAIAIAVGLAVAVQTGFLVATYRLAKWQADHPPPSAATPTSP
jgi:hypothetical protein